MAASFHSAFSNQNRRSTFAGASEAIAQGTVEGMCGRYRSKVIRGTAVQSHSTAPIIICRSYSSEWLWHALALLFSTHDALHNHLPRDAFHCLRASSTYYRCGTHGAYLYQATMIVDSRPTIFHLHTYVQQSSLLVVYVQHTQHEHKFGSQ